MKIASAKTSEARRILLSPASSALGVLAATKELLVDYLDWEPESIWLAFEGLGIDAPLETRTKTQAGLSLLTVPSFYWDGVVFEKTALAFDGHPPNPDTLEEADVHQLAWAVEEAARIVDWHKDSPWPFRHEPAAYAAVVMHRDGYALAPEPLAFAQEQLDGLNCKETPEGETCRIVPLRREAEKAWAALDKDTMDTHAFPETPAGVQLARLAGVALHCRDRRRQLEADLAALKG